MRSNTLTPLFRSTPLARAARFLRAGLLAGAAAASAALAHAAPPSPCGARLDPESILRRINDIRAQGKACRVAGMAVVAGPLLWSDSLASAALYQSREMALQQRMSHRDRSDRSLADRLRAQGYLYAAAAENVAVGYPQFDDVVVAWLESEGHCENLMSASVRESGIACADAGEGFPADERRYWTLVLGAPAR